SGALPAGRLPRVLLQGGLARFLYQGRVPYFAKSRTIGFQATEASLTMGLGFSRPPERLGLTELAVQVSRLHHHRLGVLKHRRIVRGRCSELDRQCWKRRDASEDILDTVISPFARD